MKKVKCGRKSTNYLLLDKNDPTVVCGSMTLAELAKELKIDKEKKSAYILMWLTHHGILADKYIVVEDE